MSPKVKLPQTIAGVDRIPLSADFPPHREGLSTSEEWGAVVFAGVPKWISREPVKLMRGKDLLGEATRIRGNHWGSGYDEPRVHSRRVPAPDRRVHGGAPS